ncbi:hypothetical protein Esti_000939 [Eimeria stiedai]
METDEEVCEYSQPEQISNVGRSDSASEEARPGEALLAVTGTAVNVAQPHKSAHVSFKLGQSHAHLPVELPSNRHLQDNNNRGTTIRGLAIKGGLHDSCTGEIPASAGPLHAADAAELANVAAWENRVGGEPTAMALQHDTQQNQQETAKGPLTPSHHSRDLQEAMTLLSTATYDLEGKLNSLLAQHEEDFLAAFRSHMAEVQKHIECLRDCADVQKNLVMRDLKLKTLQKDLKWFLEEAARLDQACKKTKGELIMWKARTEALREDRDFLESELKIAKRKLRNAQLFQKCKPSPNTGNHRVEPFGVEIY